MPSIRLVVLVVMGLSIACGGSSQQPDAAPPPDAGPPPPDAAPPPPGEHFDIPVDVNRDVDLLFVVDNSRAMTEKQASLARAFPQLVNVLGQITGGVPNLHVGVVSSDMGTLGTPTGDPACSDPDNGNLLKGDPDLANQCTQISGNYISDEDRNGDGTRETNYTGTLADAFSCTAALGQNGCGFEQHLESMHAALNNNPVNFTFLRSAAHLAVIILADEDDCSAAQPEFFGPESPGLGPLDSFRCFEKAVACNEGRDFELRTEGTKTGCHVDDTQDYLHDVGEYVTFLKGLKADPRDVFVGAIVGDTAPVEVTRYTPPGTAVPRPTLSPSCQYTDTTTGLTGSATPGIRLDTFAAGFPDRHVAATICDDDYTDAIVVIGEGMRPMFGYACVDDALADADMDPSNGFQPDCAFADVTDPDTTSEVVHSLPACDAGLTNKPCWHLVTDLIHCALTPMELAVAVERDTQPPPNTHVIGSCRVE